MKEIDIDGDRLRRSVPENPPAQSAISLIILSSVEQIYFALLYKMQPASVSSTVWPPRFKLSSGVPNFFCSVLSWLLNAGCATATRFAAADMLPASTMAIKLR